MRRGVASLMGDGKKISKSNNRCAVLLLLLTCTTDITVCKVTAILACIHMHMYKSTSDNRDCPSINALFRAG